MSHQLPTNYESQKNLSVVLHKQNDLRLEEKPLPDMPGKNEVLLRSSKVGICGSDVTFWTKGLLGPFVVKEPIIMGHEASARVVAVGEGVKNLKPGDRVAVEPGIPCLRCKDCREGSYNICPNVYFSACPPDNGTLTKYYKWPADFCYKLPDHVSDEEGALMEPLSVALHASDRAEIKGGQVFLICGAGPIGLINLLLVKAFGATKVCITDFNKDRLEIAKKFGATTTVLLTREQTEAETREKIITGLGRMPDTVLECCGAEASIRLAIATCKDGGKVILIGCGPNEVTIPIMTAACKELDLRGCYRYMNTWSRAVDLISSGTIDVKPLISHRFNLEQSLDAFELAKSGKGIKIMIDCLAD
ncbi:sorbitol dehydrogenase-like [Brevipalpus obovatus]|uniref:sorbitol dehydrogenase-like n=1 Tax=Brevipalpus obovatus TaxID=246614 RepID=UPI003D9EC27B